MLGLDGLIPIDKNRGFPLISAHPAGQKTADLKPSPGDALERQPNFSRQMGHNFWRYFYQVLRSVHGSVDGRSLRLGVRKGHDSGPSLEDPGAMPGVSGLAGVVACSRLRDQTLIFHRH